MADTENTTPEADDLPAEQETAATPSTGFDHADPLPNAQDFQLISWKHQSRCVAKHFCHFGH